MADNDLAALYRRYIACCNDHRFEDLADFVAQDVVINGAGGGLDVYAEELRSVVRAFPDSIGTCAVSSSTRRGSPRI
jgi:predicted ester cyclase